jgi:hypothetical protein
MTMSKVVLPYEPDYVGGRDADKRRKEMNEWLRQREREVADVRSPSIIPANHAAKFVKPNSPGHVDSCSLFGL